MFDNESPVDDVELEPSGRMIITVKPSHIEFLLESIHWEYHPNDIPRRLIRRLYNKHLAEILMDNLGYNQLTVAYSRPKNLRELLTKAKLYEVPGLEASTYYDRRGSFT